MTKKTVTAKSKKHLKALIREAIKKERRLQMRPELYRRFASYGYELAVQQFPI